MKYQSEKLAFEIGWDAGIYGLKFHEEWPTELRIGWAEARKKYPRPKQSNRYIRKWVQLRVGAFRRNKPFSEGVTPNYLKMIDMGFCPISIRQFTYGDNADSDWSVDRIDNAKGYERGNLASMTRRVNMAKSDLTYEEIDTHAETNRVIAGLSMTETFSLWGCITPFFRHENADLDNSDDYYLGWFWLPDAPLNWLMSLQLLLSMSIDPETGKSPIQGILNRTSRLAGNRKLYSKMLHQLCKDQSRSRTLTLPMYEEWTHDRNRRNLKRWLSRFQKRQLNSLAGLAKEVTDGARERMLNQNLEKWAQVQSD